jgi:hypothetical protein
MKWFCGNGFVLPGDAAHCFFYVPTVITDSGIAVSPAGSKPACNSGGGPIDVISKAWKAGSIIATASGSTASAIVGHA